jgi:hypothetical protein
LLRPACELIGPEIPDYIILYRIDHRVSEVLVRQRPDDIKQRRPWLIQERQEDHPQHVFELGIPIGSEEFFEDIDKSLCQNLLGFHFLDVQRIETEWILFVCGIKDDDVVFAAFGDMHHDLFYSIAMRIDDTDSLSLFDIVDHQ